MSRRKEAGIRDIAREQFEAGEAFLKQHPLFAPLLLQTYVRRDKQHTPCPDDGWAVVTANGSIYAHPTRRAEPEEWSYVLAHALLHLGMDHFRKGVGGAEWNVACDCVVTRFLLDLKLGRPPRPLPGADELPALDEERWYRRFREQGIPAPLLELGTAGPHPDMEFARTAPVYHPRDEDRFVRAFAAGLGDAVGAAVKVAAGVEARLTTKSRPLRSRAEQAREWFVNSFPLLGALAARFHLVEDGEVCRREQISVAAVSELTREIYINPAAALGQEECRFVIAHELLHVGLRHATRRRGRHPLLWNYACDFVVNAWLIEMQVGRPPAFGLLYDPALKDLSVESVYDRITADLRLLRKLATLAGPGQCDMLEREGPVSGADFTDLDRLYRSALTQGLSLHEERGRGLLPAGLIEEIRALSHPPIAWDVELAHWFDHHFPPLEQHRSYARPSRRQSATPDIPRPRWQCRDPGEARTFGIVLDTSGSMDRALLGKGLGAIVSYAVAHEVTAVRVVFCDAAAYDQGYLRPEEIAGSVKVKGRGGTLLQPGVDLLEQAPDFPKDGPLLIITDGECDRLHIRREHAFLIPAWARLPFAPRGELFRVE